MASIFSLEGKIAAVVGGGSGIGEAVAIECAEEGAYVSCLDIDLDGAAVTTTFDAIAEERGSLDVVVCTPGVNVRKPLLDYTDEEIDLVLGVNLKGNAHVLQSAGRKW